MNIKCELKLQKTESMRIQDRKRYLSHLYENGYGTVHNFSLLSIYEIFLI
jgi:hypothetical protein